MARQLNEGSVARLLLALGVVVFAGLLPVPYIDVAVAVLLVVVGLGLVIGWPRGNRMLGWGIAALGAVLGLVGAYLDAAPAIRNAMTTLVAALLLVAGYLKGKGHW